MEAGTRITFGPHVTRPSAEQFDAAVVATDEICRPAASSSGYGTQAHLSSPHSAHNAVHPRGRT